jgi:hypothetical protein
MHMLSSWRQIEHRLPNEELNLTARLSSGWLATLACRILVGAPQVNSSALGWLRA